MHDGPVAIATAPEDATEEADTRHPAGGGPAPAGDAGRRRRR
ncbi:hypothetical protein [Pseudonocardia sp. ICBG1293]|nr:hypothetical protein [Pseudonocardia sp. ICBG1293]